MNNAPHGQGEIGVLHDFREEACIVFVLDVHSTVDHNGGRRLSVLRRCIVDARRYV